MSSVPFDLVQLILLQVISAAAAGFVAFKSKKLWQALVFAIIASFVATFVIGFVIGFVRAIQAG